MVPWRSRVWIGLAALLASCVGGEKAVGSLAAESPVVVETPEPEMLETPEVEIGESGPWWGLLVRVVDSRTGEPVPGAVVHYCDFWMLTDRDRDEISFSMQDLEDVAARYGVRFVCDASGEVRVPWRSGHAFVSARSGNLWGKAGTGFPDPTEPFIVPIDEGEPLRVGVQDGDGLPVAGVPVSLRVKPYYSWHVAARAVSDAGGIATFHHADAYERVALGTGRVFEFWDRWGELGPVSASVDVDVLRSPVPLGGEEPGVGVSLDPPPSDPVPITLPDTGRVVVLVRGPDGVPPSRQVQVGLSSSVDDELPRGSTWSGDPGVVHGLTDATGRVEFERVALGQWIVAWIWREGRARWIRRVARGPEESGNLVHVEIPWEPEERRVVGTAVNQRGDPLVEASLQLRRPSYDTDIGRVTTDEHGRWSLTWDAVAFQVPVEVQVYLRAPFRYLATTVWLDPTGSGDIDLGVMTLRALPVLAAGRVVDTRGDPVPGVRVWPEKFFSAEGEEEEDWFGPGPYAGMSDLDGRFEVRGVPSVSEWYLVSPDSPRVQLGARGRGFTEEMSPPVRWGTRDLTITMSEPVASLSVRVRLPVGMSPSGIELDLDDSGLEPPHLLGTEDESVFTATWPAVKPGVYELTIGQYTDELMRLENVVLRSGPNRDPRLEPLDLRPELRPIEIQVLDENLQPLDDVLVAWSRAGPGRRIIWLPARIESVVVSAPGYGWREVGIVAGSLRVVLTPRRRFTVEVFGTDSLPDGWKPLVQVQHVKTRVFARTNFRSQNASYRVRYALDRLGEWAVRVGIEGEKRKVFLQAREVSVERIGELPPVRINLTAEEIRRAIRDW